MNASGDRRRALGLLALWCAGLVTVAWPTVAHLAGLWSDSDAYQSAWLVLPTLVYLAAGPWRERIAAPAPRPSLLGLALLVPGAALWLVGVGRDLMAAQHLGLVLALLAGVPLIVGVAVCRRALPVLLLPLLLVPNGDLLMPLLQPLTLFWVQCYGWLLDLPLSVDGYAVAIDGLRYRIVPACAGLPVFNLFLFIGFALGLVLYRRLAPVLALAAALAALAVLANALRVATIVHLDRLRDTQMTLADHQDVQFWIVGACLLLIVAVVTRLGRGPAAAGAALTPA